MERATRLNPASEDAWDNLGIAFDASENYPKAVDAYERALALDPRLADTWMRLSAARYFNGD